MSAPLSFFFEGRRLTARDGDTVASALYRNGVRVFGRSSKYHRPRGYRCGQGHCSACAMRIDGLPGVRTCVTKVRPGMEVEREHAWPSPRFDVLRAAELGSPLLPPGFYYRWFRHSPRLWGACERALAHAAGQGALPSPAAAARLAGARCTRRDDVDVLVVGGGIAGLSAALSAAAARARVLLVEQDDRLGGRAAGGELAVTDLTARLGAHGSVEVLTGAAAAAWYEEGVVAVDRRPDLLVVRPAAVVLATGGYDLGLPFAGWDLPGVMFATGALRLVDRYGVSPGSRAVVVATGDRGYVVAERLAAAGVDIACVADTRPLQIIDPALRAAASGVATHVGGVGGAKVRGFSAVTGLTLRVEGDGEGKPQRPLAFDCDLVCISAGLRPADDLLYQATARGSIVLAAGGPSTDPARLRAPGNDAAPAPGPELWTAGLVAGAGTVDEARAQGAAAGSAAARAARATADPA